MESSLASKIQIECLTCDICKGSFIKPKALPCLHTFCCECLDRYVHTNISRYLPCPVCRRKFKVPRKGIGLLPSNHLVNGITELIERHVAYQGRLLLKETERVCVPAGDIVGANLLSELVGNFAEEGSSLLIPGNTHPESVQDLLPSAGATPTTPDVGTDEGNLVATPSTTDALELPTPTTTRSTSRSDLSSTSSLAQAHISDRNDQSPDFIWAQNLALDKCPHHEALAFWVDTHLTDTEAIHHFGQYGPNLADFTAPMSLATAPTGEVVVSDLRENRVIVHNRQGSLYISFQCHEEIRGVSLTSDKRIVVAVAFSETNAIHFYSMAGEHISSVPKKTPYEQPHGITVTHDDKIYMTMVDSGDVCSLENININAESDAEETPAELQYKIFNRNGTKTPYYITTSRNGNILISDAENNAVQVYNDNGEAIFTLGANELKAPRGICTDYKDNIIVADAKRRAVFLYNSKGKLIRTMVEYPRDRENKFMIFPVDVSIRNFELFVLVVAPFYCQVRIYGYRHGPQNGETQTSICSTM